MNQPEGTTRIIQGPAIHQNDIVVLSQPEQQFSGLLVAKILAGRLFRDRAFVVTDRVQFREINIIRIITKAKGIVCNTGEFDSVKLQLR